MRYMNEWDIASAEQRYRNHPILGAAVQTLRNLKDWTNANSDGWAYWKAPVQAAKKLIELIEGDDHPRGRAGAYHDDERKDATAAMYRAALRPIKSFRTKHRADFEVVEP